MQCTAVVAALSSIENPELSEVFKQWNSSCPLPTLKDLSDILHRDEYETIKTKISQ